MAAGSQYTNDMANQAMNEAAGCVEWRNETLSVNTAFEVLADGHRRTVVAYLLEHDAEVPVAELVDQVADADGIDDRNRVRVAFAHKHLPKMVDAGLVEYHDDSATVEPCPSIEKLAPFVEWAEEFERSQA